MAVNFSERILGTYWSRKPLRGLMAVVGFAVLSGSFGVAQAAPDASRLDWSKLSPEQQIAVKSSGIQGKEVSAPTQKYYVYQNGQQVAIESKGDPAQAVFRIVGSGTDLRHVGRGEIKLAAAKSTNDIKIMLEPFGLQLDASKDTAGLVWMVQTPSGMDGLKALNKLKESGLVLSASPDWQRDLRKK